LCVCVCVCERERVSARVRAVTGRLLALTGSPYRALLVFSGISTLQCSRYELLVEIVGWRGERGSADSLQELRKFMKCITI